MAANFASSLILSTTAYLGKAFLRFGTKDLRVDGLPILLKALEENPQSQISNVQKDAQDGLPGRPRRRGVVTICNHNSVVDDPFMWSILPIQNFLPFALPAHTSRHSRWTLGARDIMFTNPIFSKFFTSGQVINTERGGGIFQPAIDEAVKRLQDGEWIHIFPEAKVNQRKTNPDGGILRFKWGIGRIIMDSETMPEIIPMWISGFDQIMPETRGFPRFVPRTGARISITVGEPLTTQIQPLVDKWRGLARQESGTVGVGGKWEAEGNSPPGEKQRDIRESGYLSEGQEEAVRIQITSALQDGLQKLGQSVEEAEGRIASGEWCHSISKSQRGLVQ